jgi:hypothetical protein
LPSKKGKAEENELEMGSTLTINPVWFLIQEANWFGPYNKNKVKSLCEFERLSRHYTSPHKKPILK